MGFVRGTLTSRNCLVLFWSLRLRLAVEMSLGQSCIRVWKLLLLRTLPSSITEVQRCDTSQCRPVYASSKVLSTSIRRRPSLEREEMSSLTSCRDLKNEDRYVTVDVLENDNHNSVCAVKLLVIHALRIGAVSANSWTALRAQILSRADQTLQWVTPNKPVVAAIVPGHCSFLDVNKPATTSQMRSTIHAMSLKARVAVSMTPHDLRRGAVADLAHLPAGSLNGNATADVAMHVGHKMTTFKRDVTTAYAGPSDISTWNLRAQSTWVDRCAPRVAATPFIPTPMTKEDVSAYAEARGLDASDRLVINNARKHVRKQQEAAWREMARNEPANTVSSTEIPNIRRVLGPAASAKVNAALGPKAVDIPIDPQVLGTSKTTVASVSADESVASIPTESSSDDISMELTDEQSENAQFILQVLTGTQVESEAVPDESDEAQQEQLLEALEDLNLGANDPPHPIFCSPEKFIENFSKINIIRNTAAGNLGKEKFAKQMGTFVAQGCSRDAPTQYIYYCANDTWGCSFQTTYKESFDYHALSCKISQDNPVEPEIYKCRKANCDARFKTNGVRIMHELNHDFKARECHLGCTDKKLFTTNQQWAVHKSRYHDTEWDTSMTCQVPQCSRTSFPNRDAYSKHLAATHKLRGADLKQYVPQRTHRDPVFGKRSCPFPDCARAAPGKEFEAKKKLEGHLRSKIGGHECTDDEIEKLISDMLASGRQL
ncbi:hypothetical protein ONS95_005825 [Cadophora gregata]|uniref:uncharacterized protein n=1 Tax=Cadophora gregata TaxID=51156 RepID=UPI0026DCE117|nr:uncharacterized protein ONS95_005825 [Cadophora gregata]KAK0103826.1 hypothetical protein ONS95_005825 [Cadophora gregata]KAK0108013.1 hypothetical protein ONS96_003792 [Cadophora gregata f. sp. sojae]